MKTKQQTRKAANQPLKINTQATYHIGAIDCDGSQTPIGINIFGVTFEDANYDLADKFSETRYASWQRNIIRQLMDGNASGNVEGLDWKFIPEKDRDSDPDTDPLYSWPAWRVATAKLQAKSEPGSKFQDPDTYKALTPIAQAIRESLQGDGGYEKPAINFIALQERIVGYIMAQDWYRDYEKHCMETKISGDASLLAHDLAIQLATDAITTTLPGFATE